MGPTEMAAAEANEGMEEEQSMGELFAANNEYQLAEQLLPPPVPLDQAQALSGLFADADACKLCETTLGARWQNVCLSKWELLKPAGDEVVGEQIVRVAEELGTPVATHLLPTTIHQKLKEGFAPTCYGLATLLDNMKDITSAAPAED